MSRVCDICGSDRGVRNYQSSGNYYCARHVCQLNTYGRIFIRTKFDPNEIIIKEDFALLCLYDKDVNEIARAIINLTDVDLVSKYKWYLHSSGYVCCRNEKDGCIYLHRLILNVTNDSFVDHINMNKLDNRKENLRLCTNSENMRNKEEMANNYSGFRGVVWHKDVRKWGSSLTCDKKVIKLGWYDLFNDAVSARLKGEAEYYGEFAPNTINVNNNEINKENK